MRAQCDEAGLHQQLDDVREMLSEIHPIILEDDNANVDSVEENRMVRQLEEMQMRALAKTMKRVVDNDEEHEAVPESIDDSDDEDLDIPADSFERVESRTNDNRNVIDVNKFEQLWTDYKGNIIHGSNIDAKEVK